MNDKFVLNRERLDDFLHCVLNSEKSTDDEINALIEDCSLFDMDIHSNNYFLSRIIQKKISDQRYPDDYVKTVYDLMSAKSFYLEEFDSRFIRFLIAHISDKSVDIDDSIMQLQEKYINNSYGEQVRY